MKTDPTSKLDKTVYTPEPAIGKPKKLLSDMFQDLIDSRELAWRLCLRNISAKYRQTIMGYIWVILPPLLTSFIWIFLNNQNILKFGEARIPYPLYVLVGTILWQVFVNSINTPINVVKESASMIAKINFPRESLILAAFLEILFHLAIQLCLLAGIFAYFKVPISFYSIWALGGIISIIMTGIMVGVILAPFCVLYGDIQQGLPIILQPLFYLTPIVYSPPKTGIGAVLAMINPISPIIQFTRELLIIGDRVCLGSTAIISSITLLLLFCGWILYRVAMPHLVERIAS